MRLNKNSLIILLSAVCASAAQAYIGDTLSKFSADKPSYKTYALKNDATGGYIEVKNGSSNDGAIIWTNSSYTGADHQRFRFIAAEGVDNGYYIQAVHSKKYLTLTPGTSGTVQENRSNKEQLFNVKFNSDGGIVIVSDAAKKCLENGKSDYLQMFHWNCNGTSHQLWRLTDPKFMSK